MGELLLDVQDLSISFGGLVAVDTLSFSINKGEIYGIIGPNGAGKTTVFNCITQFYKANSGKAIYYHPEGPINLMDLKVDEVISKGIVRTFQNVEVVNELSILENVLIGGHKDFKTNLLQQIFSTNRTRIEEQQMIDKAINILEKFELLTIKDQPVGLQPYGIRKKVEFARALMCDPTLIILDEPAAGLNDKETEEFAQLIKNIRDESKLTILLIEHDMGLVMGICDRICAINFGKLLDIGTPAEIQNHPEVQQAYLGVDNHE